MHSFVHHLATDRSGAKKKVRCQHGRPAHCRIKHPLPQIRWSALQHRAMSSLHQTSPQRDGGVSSDDLSIQQQLVLPFLRASMMSNGIAESLGFAVDVIIVPAQPISEVVAGFNLDRELETQILIWLVKGRASRSAKVNVLFSPLELWSRIRRGDVLRK